MRHISASRGKLASTVVIVGLMLTTLAHADRKTSRALFDEGTQHYRVGRFADAAADYEKAYEAEPIPALLFNIAQAHQEAGTFERAIFFYESYLRETPDAENRELVLERISEARAALKLERKTTERQAEAARVEAETERARIEAEARHDELKRAEEERRAAQARAREAQARAQQSEAAVVPLVEQAWFWPAVGLAGSAAAVAALAAVGAGGTTATVMVWRTRNTLPTVSHGE